MKNSRTFKSIIAIILLVVTLFTFGGCDIIMAYLELGDVSQITALYFGGDIEVGGSINKDNIYVEATWVEQTTGMESKYQVKDFDVSPLDSSTGGEKELTISYTYSVGEATKTVQTTLTVNVVARLVGIEVTCEPIKVGETLTNAHFLVQEVYNDNTKVTVSNFTFSAVDTSSAGTKQTTVTYQKSGSTYTEVADVVVMVEDTTLQSITATANNVTFYVGNLLLLSDFAVTAHFTDGSTAEVSDFNIVNPTGTLATAGQTEVELAYTFDGQTRYTTLFITVLDAELPNYGKYGILSDDGKSVKITDTAKVVDTTDLQIHFLQLGNQYTGDSIYIKAGDTDILIDAGSRYDSTNAIDNYIKQHITDGTLEYVIATHADQDHISGFVSDSKNSNKGIFKRYVCENIIDFPRSNKSTNVATNYKSERDAEVATGANHYTALECWNNNNESTRFSQSVDATGARRYIKLSANVEMEILYNYYYENKTSDENDYSVCLMINQYGANYDFANVNNPDNAKNVNHFLFTGDLEESGEGYLVQYNDLPEVVLFKGGHHGSKTSTTDILLNVIKPKVVCICCCTGTGEYNANPENTFPAQSMINRVAKHTDLVFATSLWVNSSTVALPLNGNITLTCNNLGVILTASNNVTLLKDTDWFKANRTCPTQWL